VPHFRETLRDCIRAAVLEVLGADGQPLVGESKIARRDFIDIERPRQASHGDFSTNVAMALANQAAMSPRELATAIADRIEVPPGFSPPNIAGPGFLNFSLEPSSWGSVVVEILESGPRYGTAEQAKDKRINVEFVSANPTGPMHLGHARWAAWGDALAKLLETAGHSVTREFYINDAGNQIDLLGRTIAARYLESIGREAQIPEDGYKGDYIIDLASELTSQIGNTWADLGTDELAKRCAEWGSNRMLEEIQTQLDRLGVTFDVWTSERQLRDSGRVASIIEELRKRGFVSESEGAVWFASTKAGDDKDRVLVKSDGQPTYLAVDIAYHAEKFAREFDVLIDIWGADHAGHVPKLKLALDALGFDASRLEVILGQLVSLSRAGEPVRMSKRSGELFTFEELVDEIGPDAARFHFLMQGPDTALHLDIEKAVERSLDNPVYYVQYAHARICSILRKAAEQGVGEPVPDWVKDGRLETAEEITVLKRLEEYPYLIGEAAALRAPHKLSTWARGLASEFHTFYQKRRVLQAETPDLVRARLALVAACKQVLANCLGVLGVSAPEAMEKLDSDVASADED
jgi:arginyl-tRNA synthetase